MPPCRGNISDAYPHTHAYRRRRPKPDTSARGTGGPRGTRGEGKNAGKHNTSRSAGISGGVSDKRPTRTGAVPTQAKRSAVSYAADGWVRAADVTPAVPSSSGIDGEKGLYKDLSEPILELVSVVEGMGADITFLKTVNKRQAKELVRIMWSNRKRYR